MALRGGCFLLELGADEQTLEKLVALQCCGLHVSAAVRKQNSLWVRLDVVASTQRIAEAVGPGVPVSRTPSVPVLEAPPGTDWFVRSVGSPYVFERSLPQVLNSLKEVADEIGETDLVQLQMIEGDPAILDMRVSTRRGERLESKRVRMLELAERLGISMLVQPLTIFRKPKGLACFDLDSTLVSEELIIEVAKKAGREEQVERITKMAMAGELDYKRSFIQRVALLRGVAEKDMLEVWESVRPSKEVIRLLDTLRMRGIRTAILSGAFSFFTERARERLGVDFSVGNDVEILDGRLTGNVKGEIVDGKVKVKKMRELAASLNLTLDQVVAVGDGANDLDIVTEAGTGIAFNKGGVVKAYADALVPNGRLGDMLFLIG